MPRPSGPRLPCRDMSQHVTDRFGLIHASSEFHSTGSYRSLWADVQRGRLVKLRRGIYAEAPHWSELDPRERHMLRIRAAAASASSPIAVAGYSAAALWGMPIGGDWPDEVTLIDRWRGGGRSAGDVRRTARDFGSAQLYEVDGIRCTGIARTALDLARVEPLPGAVATMDWCLSRSNPIAITKDDLWHELGRLNQWAPRRRLEGTIHLATHLSGSFGESEARVVIFQLGYADPVLQQEFVDEEGTMFADFTWPRVRVVGEFDGKVKYTREEYTKGDPGEVVWREKRRQDRFGRIGYSMFRVITPDVKDPRRLDAILRSSGVPRA